MDDIDNYKIILDKFKKLDSYEQSTIKKEIGNNKHTDVRKLLSKYYIVKPWDINRACGICNYFDIAELKMNKIIKSNSKLVVARPTADPRKSIVYVYQNWEAKYQEIQEKILDRGYYEGFILKNRKIKGWFIEENILKFGTRRTGDVYVEFEKANLNSLIKQKYYFMDEEISEDKHLAYQSQISALGVYFGYNSKLAKGEKSEEIFDINLITVACLTMKDLDLNNLNDKVAENKIDYIDVIWTDGIGKIAAVFEIELKRDWEDALIRLQYLKTSCIEYRNDIYYIIVGSEPYKDLPAIRDYAKSWVFYRDFKDAKLKYLSLQMLFDILARRDNWGDSYILRKDFFSGNTLSDILY